MISVIAAVGRGGVIGAGNRMPWHIAEDLRRFRAITTGHPVVMGRKTWESLGRPLPGRTNVVVTRQRDYCVPAGVRVVGSLAEAVALFPADEEVFVIGGGEIYREAMPLAGRFCLTEVDVEVPQADTRFPAWNPRDWREVFTERHDRGAAFEHPFVFRDFVRVGE